MGLAVTTVGVEGVKRAVAEVMPIMNFSKIRLTDSYQVYYKADIDVTDLDTFCVQADNNAANDGLLKISLDANLIDTITFNNGAWTSMDTNDISAYTGVYTVKIELKGNGAAISLEHFVVWFKAA